MQWDAVQESVGRKDNRSPQVALNWFDQISIEVLQVSLCCRLELAACGCKLFPLDAAADNMAFQVFPGGLKQFNYSMPLRGKDSASIENENENVVAADEIFDERLFGRKARRNVCHGLRHMRIYETLAQDAGSGLFGKTERSFRRFIGCRFDKMRIDILTICQKHHLQVIGTEVIP